MEVRRLQEEEKRAALPAADAENPPLVRVAIRAANADDLWEKVFERLYEQENILADQLGPSETFKDKQAAEPCHGFLIVCDEAVLRDESLVRRAATSSIAACSRCRRRTPRAGRRSASVYWPPPDPSWSRLLRSTPLRLFRVLGSDALQDLGDFIEDVSARASTVP